MGFVRSVSLMVFNVKITESYTYSRQVECADESELSEILHEEHPLLVDLPRQGVERIRQNGLHLHCAYEW